METRDSERRFTPPSCKEAANNGYWSSCSTQLPSVPTSLCKTKDPYNVCTEKNLQMSCQNLQQSNKKSQDNIPKEAITNDIISSMEGKRRKDNLQRSVSLNHEKKILNKNSSSNIGINDTADMRSSGRHILPAIVPEMVTETRKKMSSRSTDDIERGEYKNTTLAIEQSQKRQPISKRRKTIAGIEMLNNNERNGNFNEDRPSLVTDQYNRINFTNEILTNNWSATSNISNKHPNLSDSQDYRYQMNSLSKTPTLPIGRQLPQFHKQSAPLPSTSNYSKVPLERLSTSSIYSNMQMSRSKDVQCIPQHEIEEIANDCNTCGIRNTTNSQQFVPTSNYSGVTGTANSNHQINVAPNEVTPMPHAKRVWDPPRNRYENETSTNGDIGAKSQIDPINLSVKEQMIRNMDLVLNERKSSELLVEPSVSTDHMSLNDDPYPVLRTFPGIQDQISRIGISDSQPANDNRSLAKAKTLVKISQEFAIRSSIDKAKAAMSLPFCLDRLVEMNESYKNLQSFVCKRNVSKKLKMAITAVINELTTYVSYQFFGKRESVKYRIYSEKIMEAELAEHKPLIFDFIRIGVGKTNNELAINAFVKLLRGEHDYPVLPSSPHQLPHTHYLLNFHPRITPSVFAAADAEGQQVNRAIEPYNASHPEKQHNSRRNVPGMHNKGVSNHQRILTNEERVPNIHHQKSVMYGQVENRIPPPLQMYRQVLSNVSRPPAQVSNSAPYIDMSNDGNTVTSNVLGPMKKRTGQDVEELLPPNIIIGKEVFEMNGNQETLASEDGKNDPITKTVIVKDNSMEITKGDKQSKILKEQTNEIVLEKIQRPSNKKEEVLKVDIKKEPPEDSNDNNNYVQDDLQIFKKYLLEEDRSVYRNVMKKVVSEKEAKKKSEVIMIVDDDDIQIKKVEESTGSPTEKSHKLSQKNMNHDTTSSKEIMIVDDDDDVSHTVDKIMEDTDLNQNYIPLENNKSKTMVAGGKPRREVNLYKTSGSHMPIIEDISSDEEPTRPVKSYRDHGHIKNASAIIEQPTTKTNVLINSYNNRPFRNVVDARRPPPVGINTRRPPTVEHETELANLNNRMKERQKPKSLQFDRDMERKRCNKSPLRHFPSTSNSFPAQYPRHPQRSPGYGVGAVAPAVAKSPVIAGSPSSSESASPLLQCKSKPNWQAWFSDERQRGFFDLDQTQTGSRRQSVETISSVGSDYTPKAITEQDLVKIKVDSKWYRIERSLYDRLPKGKLCYVRETRSFIRYFDDDQMAKFIVNLDGNPEMSLNLLRQIRGRVGNASDHDTYLGGSDQNEVLTLAEDPDFSRDDNIADPELYVQEVLKVERFAPRDFYGYYKFVTGYQIIHDNSPVSFHTFLTVHNTNGIKQLFNQYVHKLLGKSVSSNKI